MLWQMIFFAKVVVSGRKVPSVFRALELLEVYVSELSKAKIDDWVWGVFNPNR